MRSRLSPQTGEAIRKLRTARGWTLAQLSEKSGIPLSTLSRVELGQNALNYEKLVRLARALEIDLDAFMSREAGAAAPAATGRRTVIRAGEGASVRIGPAAGLAAGHDLLARSLSPVILEITARSLEDHGPLVSQPGECYLMVMAGEAVLQSALYTPLTLAAGDAVYFDATQGFGLTAPKGSAWALLVAPGQAEFV
jgi:transcriptional regulator with XRE-family HTH domain